MKHFKPAGWSRAIVSPFSAIVSQALGGLSGKDRRKVQLLQSALETAEAECDRLRQEIQDLVQYTDVELANAKQKTERVIQERDDLQIKVLLLEEEISVQAHANLAVQINDSAVASSIKKSSKKKSSKSTSQPLPPSSISLDLSNFRLALVGGHPTTRRGVIQELQTHYGLKHFVEIPRMNEANTSRNRVKSKIHRCNLVVLITGYMSHRLTEIVFSLKDAGALAGDVLQVSSKGKSGVLRGILDHVDSSTC